DLAPRQDADTHGGFRHGRLRDRRNRRKFGGRPHAFLPCAGSWRGSVRAALTHDTLHDSSSTDGLLRVIGRLLSPCGCFNMAESERSAIALWPPVCGNNRAFRVMRFVAL